MSNRPSPGPTDDNANESSSSRSSRYRLFRNGDFDLISSSSEEDDDPYSNYTKRSRHINTSVISRNGPAEVPRPRPKNQSGLYSSCREVTADVHIPNDNDLIDNEDNRPTDNAQISVTNVQNRVGPADIQTVQEPSQLDGCRSDHTTNTTTDRDLLESSENIDEVLEEADIIYDEWFDCDAPTTSPAASEDYSSSSEDDYAELPKDKNSSPLYDNCGLTLADSILTILSLAFRFTLSGECITAILELILLHCPKPNLCVQSIKKLKKMFSHISAPMQFHYFCSKCSKSLSKKDSVCPLCQKKSSHGYFIELSVVHQLQSLFMRPSFHNDLQYRFHREKRHIDGIEDIYDGEVYKEQVRNGFLSDPNNISYMWYTDGVPLFKSSKFGIWPLYYSINELPYTKRTLTHNMIVAGLWFGPSKPDMNTFLSPLGSTLKSLYAGIEINLPHLDSKLTVRSQILCGTSDLPAKCLVHNTVQFNGAYGCSRCLQRGSTHKLTPRSGVHIYPFQENLELRTHEQTINHGLEARLTGQAVYGVKGPSMMARLVPDIIRSTAVDVMHSLYLGITKRLLQLWFLPAFSKYPFSLSLMIGVADRKLVSIKPPNFVPRVPRTISEHLCYWKASELKAWLYYYSLPVLTGLMKNEYLSHHAKLISSVFILNKRSILRSELITCQQQLQAYVKEFQELYGERFMSANMHQLLYYTDAVYDLGPLWVPSCFPFESMNGKITRLVHGTRYAELQICASISFVQNLPFLVSSLPDGSATSKFCTKITSGKKLNIKEEISGVIFSIGSYVHLDEPLPLQIAEALYNSDITGGNCQMFYRLKKANILFCSTAYTNIKKTASYLALFGKNNHAGIIEKFIRWSDCNCRTNCKCKASYFAIVSLFENMVLTDELMYHDLDLSFLKKLSPTFQLQAVPVEDLHTLCFYINFDNVLYCAQPVNNIEEE